MIAVSCSLASRKVLAHRTDLTTLRVLILAKSIKFKLLSSYDKKIRYYMSEESSAFLLNYSQE